MLKETPNPERMCMRLLRLSFLLFLACFPYSILAQSNQAPNLEKFSLTAQRINRNIDLRGNLSDPLWQSADYVALNYEISPGDNTKPRQRSYATVLYNSEYFYVGFKFYDTNPEEIRANISDRDRLFGDDFAVAIFDTYGDYQRTYEFIVNPHGIQGDILRQGNDEDESFDTVWESAASIGDSGWTAEMAIPLKSIRFPAKPNQEWVLLMGRNYPRESRYIYSWTPFDRNNPCFTCQGGKLLGIKNIESFTALDMLPYAIGTHSGSLRDGDDPSSVFDRGDLKGRAGIGVRYAPNPDLNIDAAINPDFSQVESDASQISVNTTFALFYPEKRPFFQLGKDLFNTRIDAYYSRMINDPIGAAKTTAKVGKLTLAYLGALDRKSPLIIPGEDGSDFISTGRQSFSNILRTRYDFGDEAFIGALLTTRNFSGAHNYLGGIDWNYLFWGNYYFQGQALYSKTGEIQDTVMFSSDDTFGRSSYSRSFDGEDYAGTAFTARFSRNARDYSFDISVQDYSPTFQAYNGFVSQTNQRTLRFEHRYSYYYDDNPIIDRWNISNEMGMEFNYAGQRKERWFGLGVNAEFKSQTGVFIGFIPVNQELFQGIYFPSIERMFFEVWSNPLNELRTSVHAEIGKFIYRDDPPELGTGHNINVSATVKPTTRLLLDLSYSRARLTSTATKALLYDGYILRANSTYQFTRELFLRLITEYNHFGRSVNVYPLLSYKLNPFTIFYAGATYDGRDFDDSRRNNFVQTRRQFFVKFQYLIRS